MSALLPLSAMESNLTHKKLYIVLEIVRVLSHHCISFSGGQNSYFTPIELYFCLKTQLKCRHPLEKPTPLLLPESVTPFPRSCINISI